MFQCELWIKPYKSLSLSDLRQFLSPRLPSAGSGPSMDPRFKTWNENWLSEGWFWVVGSSWTHQDQKKWKFKARFLINLNLVRWKNVEIGRLNNVTFGQDRKWLSRGISRESRVSRDFFQRLVKMKFLLSWEEAEEEPWDAFFKELSIDENY